MGIGARASSSRRRASPLRRSGGAAAALGAAFDGAPLRGGTSEAGTPDPLTVGEAVRSRRGRGGSGRSANSRGCGVGRWEVSGGADAAGVVGRFGFSASRPTGRATSRWGAGGDASGEGGRTGVAEPG